MGSKLNGFNIELTFDDEGRVVGILYGDGLGCGKEVDITGDMTIDRLVRMHLRHYAEDHNSYPKKRCQSIDLKSLPPKGMPPLELPRRCLLNEMPAHTEHTFEAP